MKLQHYFLIILSSLIPFAGHTKPESNPVPGGIALLAVESGLIATSASYQNKKIAIINKDNKNYFLIGLALSSKPGIHSIKVKNQQGEFQKISFRVKPKTYKAQYLTIKNKRKVNPYKNDMARILKEKKRKNKARKNWRNEPVKADFSVPVDGRISSIFGLRRFFNEQARRPHSGLDIAAPQGTAIRAIESGRVIESGNFFFSGNMVYLDHGQGLISLYAHMHEIQVKPGEQVHKGQIIGTVGETGRVTGPHLHLAVIANQTLVDPLLFLPQLKDKAQAYFKANP